MATYSELCFLWFDRMAISAGDGVNNPDGFQPWLVDGKHKQYGPKTYLVSKIYLVNFAMY
jgi:hypothetical protein